MMPDNRWNFTFAIQKGQGLSAFLAVSSLGKRDDVIDASLHFSGVDRLPSVHVTIDSSYHDQAAHNVASVRAEVLNLIDQTSLIVT